jgi:1,4-dihydroxy-2-naphthoate octaprenyltransferase
VAQKKKTSTAPSKRSGRPGAVKTVAHSATATVRLRPVGWRDWVSAARPATLGLALAPVISGWGMAMLHLRAVDQETNSPTVWALTALAALVAVFLQVGVNFANDYSDGIRGTDANRTGPQRLTASGQVEPKRVRLFAFVFFGLAAVAGLAITVITQIWWLPAVGAVAIVAAWFYTGGKRPYGYAGLGELSVFVFFGLVEVVGTVYILTNTVWLDSVLLGVAHGLFACAVLLANNIRDRATDTAVGKRTLATRMPMWLNRAMFGFYMSGPFAVALWFALTIPNTGWIFFATMGAIPAVIIVATARTAPEYVLALKISVWTSLGFAAIAAATLGT